MSSCPSREHPDRALAGYTAVIAIDPQCARAYHQRGLLYAEKEDGVRGYSNKGGTL